MSRAIPIRHTLRGAERLAKMLRVTGGYVARAPFDPPNQRTQPYYGPRKAQRWARELLAALDVRLTAHGHPADVPALYVANHRSYLDIIGIASLAPVRFVAKAELSRWPVLGSATALGGSIFIDRADRQDRDRARARVAGALRDGQSVCVFPEGTTHATGVGELRRGAFQVATAAGVPVVPVALEYADPTHAWVGDDDFVSHFVRTFGPRHFGAGSTQLTVSLGAPIPSHCPIEAHAAATAFIAARVLKAQMFP